MARKNKALREIAAMRIEAEAALTRATADCKAAEDRLEMLNVLAARVERPVLLLDRKRKPPKAREQVVKQFGDEATKAAFEKMHEAAGMVDQHATPT